jgi:Domain of unknown function (DUF1707)
MARRSALRASDSDREWVAERLRHATAEGRLLASELEERLGAAFTARTYGELDGLVADLPVPRESRRHAVPLWARGAFAIALVLAALAVVAVVALVVAGLFATWLFWIGMACLFCGRGRGRRVRHSRPRIHATHRPEPGRGYWI